MEQEMNSDKEGGKVDIKQEEYFFNHKKKTITILKGNVKWLNLEKLLKRWI